MTGYTMKVDWKAANVVETYEQNVDNVEDEEGADVP